MPNPLKSFLASLAVTVVIAVVALMVALAASTSGSGANGIGAYAGGVSRTFVRVLVLALPVIFIGLFFIFRRVFRGG